MVRKSKRGTQFRQWANKVLYLFGASLKDAGKKLFAYIKMQETPATELKLTIIGAQRSPFYALYDTLKPYSPYSVVIRSPCRNNSDKNLANFLESAQNSRTFAAVKDLI